MYGFCWTRGSGNVKKWLCLGSPGCVVEALVPGNTLGNSKSTFNFHTVLSFVYLTSDKNSVFVNAE